MAYELESVRTQGMDLAILSDELAIPITLAEVKAHLSIDFNDQDTYLLALLASAFREVEIFTQKSLKVKSIRQSYKQINGCVQLAYSPVTAITSVKDFSNVTLDYQKSFDGTKIYAYSENGIVIVFTAGFTTIPADLKFAVLDIVSMDFDNNIDDKKLALKAIKERIRHYRPQYV
jgi:hypothetical protein